MPKSIRVVGISFEHMHMGDNLLMAHQHPDCEVVGVCDSQLERTHATMQRLGLSDSQAFVDWEACMDACQPDLLITCPATADHGDWVQRLAPMQIPILMEKPMASSLADADSMIAACREHGTPLAINWPLVWVPSHRLAKKMIDDGQIGDALEVHYYGGNRGPLWHTAGKESIDAETVAKQKPESWFYKQASGGGSLLDYLGYGTTLGTWYLGGQSPIEVTCVCDSPEGLEVDEHSITVARYSFGISKFETRWGTFTDPWTDQPQPKCGFVIVGSKGTISSYDYEGYVLLQTEAHPQGERIPAEPLEAPEQNPVQHFVSVIRDGAPLIGPLTPTLSRLGQQIVDTALESARQRRTIPLLG
ncbi:MAG: Gfo/Idh/MocA family oxidoreductase [Planctomycetota bacterium]